VRDVVFPEWFRAWSVACVECRIENECGCGDPLVMILLLSRVDVRALEQR
jgi:hypothetical protein